MLRSDSNRFLATYENRTYGGNSQWAVPEEAVKVGEAVGEELYARFADSDIDTPHDSPRVRDSALKVLDAALSVVNYAGLPTERRANILRGVINSLEKAGALGGEPEWAVTTPKESSAS